MRGRNKQVIQSVYWRDNAHPTGRLVSRKTLTVKAAEYSLALTHEEREALARIVNRQLAEESMAEEASKALEKEGDES